MGRTWVDTVVESDTCLLYQIDTEAGVRYAVQVLIALGGDVRLRLSNDEKFDALLRTSSEPGDQVTGELLDQSFCYPKRSFQ